MRPSANAVWMQRPEGGGRLALWLIRAIALHIGRWPARLALIPAAAYFVLRRGPERRASLDFLTRVFDRPATWWDVAKHMYSFATVTLDRVFLLTEAFRRFDIRVHGIEELHDAIDLRRGVLLIGAHLGSFEALRILALQRPDHVVRPVIDLEQNPSVSILLNTLNPALAANIINARHDGMSTAFAIHEAIQQKAIVTLLADRSRPGNDFLEVEFLGSPAALPTAPWLLAATLKVPVVLCFALYQGGNRYDLFFEPFSERLQISRGDRAAALRAVMQRFADRLDAYVRMAPFNWFNFYDFWKGNESCGTP